MVEEKVRFSDAELAEFKELILAKLEKAKTDLDLIKSAYLNDLNNGTDDTSPTFKAFEEGSETMSKEANSQLVPSEMSELVNEILLSVCPLTELTETGINNSNQLDKLLAGNPLRT